MVKNTFTNCKLLFDIEKTWQNFDNNWHKILYDATKSIFEKKWADFLVNYKIDHWVTIYYFDNNEIAIWKEKIIKYYKNKFYYFENTIISHIERDYAKIKYWLNNILTGIIIKCFFN